MEPNGELFNEKLEEENGSLGYKIPSVSKGTEGCQEIRGQGESEW